MNMKPLASIDFLSCSQAFIDTSGNNILCGLYFTLLISVMADLNADEFYLKLIKNLQLPGKAGLTELYQLYDQAVAHYEATHILNERKCVAGENVKGESPVVELNSTVDISESVDSELELVGEPKEKRPDSVGKKEAEVTIKPVKTELMKVLVDRIN